MAIIIIDTKECISKLDCTNRFANKIKDFMYEERMKEIKSHTSNPNKVQE